MQEQPRDDEPDTAAPWAMQLVLHVERTAPPSRGDLCAAAGTAVVRLLTDERAAPGGPWHDQVRHWADSRIRKHARRARGVAWTRVEVLPGVTARYRDAEVRALVPGPLDALPPEISRLQLTGSELPELGPTRVEARPGGPIVVAICPEPPLSLGKAAAAAGHAAQLALVAMPDARRTAWIADGLSVEVEHLDAARWHALRAVARVHVVDAGFTEVAPGSTTAVARWA